MSFNFVIVLVTIVICDIYEIKAQLQETTNCPSSDLHFEKILGIRPAGHHQKLLLLQSNGTAASTPLATQDCLTKCQDNEECLSFLLDYKNNECYWYRREVQEEINDEEVVPDVDIAWFVRTCLKVQNCSNGWKFERLPGATLIGNNTRKLPEAMTRQQCQQLCLNEDQFKCRSCKFRVIKSVEHPGRTLGICVLSDTDRHVTPSAYRVSSYSDEYFENQCVTALKDTNTIAEFCSYEEYDNVQLSHVDNIFANRTKLECQNLCDKTDFYQCRAYSVIPEKGKQQKFVCKLHSEDSKVHGPRLLVESEGAKYYERVPCLNITVNCTDDDMTVRFQPEVKYGGRMYMQGYSENQGCYAKGAGHAPVILKILLTPQNCGIFKAKSSLNSTLLSSTMILQYNALVQTQADRLIKVGCIFGNETKVVLGAGFNFSQETASSGSISVNSSFGTPPRVQLRVIDLSSQNEVSDTQIGEELQLIIELESRGPYDIWAGHLVAMTENGQDSILLLDDRGCPTNLDVFPALTRIATNDTIQLVSTFQAFKFSSSNVIRFSVMVQFCVDRCPQMDCGISLATIRKRDTENNVDSVNSTEIAKVSQEDPKRKKIVHEMPLEFVMVVRNGKLTADKLVYGENNKILVAGYDYVTNEVCLDYFLIIALVITWIIIQIIFLASGIALIRKYKKHYERQNISESLEDLQKNFQYGNMSNMGIDNRRVHFLEE